MAGVNCSINVLHEGYFRVDVRMAVHGAKGIDMDAVRLGDIGIQGLHSKGILVGTNFIDV